MKSFNEPPTQDNNTYIHIGGTLGSSRGRSSRRSSRRIGQIILGLRRGRSLRGRIGRSWGGTGSRSWGGTGSRSWGGTGSRSWGDEGSRLALGLGHSGRRSGRTVVPGLLGLLELTAIVTAFLDAHVLLGAGQIVVAAVAVGERSFVPLTLAEACLLVHLVALALGPVGDVNILVVLLAALGTAGLGAGITWVLAIVLLAARLDAGLLGGRIAVKTTVGLCGETS